MPRKKTTEEWAADLRPLEELTLEERLTRLDARDAHPHIFHAARDRHEALMRDAQDREDAREAWHRSGGDPKDFAAQWQAISTEAKRIMMLEEQRAAREGFAAYERGRF